MGRTPLASDCRSTFPSIESGSTPASAAAKPKPRRWLGNTTRYATLQPPTLRISSPKATSQYELIRLFRDDIIPKADQTLRVSSSAYETGKTDFLQLIDNWRQLIRFQVACVRLESQLRQTLASLDRVMGGERLAEL